MSKVTVHYDLKAPVGGDFTNKFAPRPEAGVFIEFEVDDKTTDFQQTAEDLFVVAKMMVAKQLDIALVKDANGILNPVFDIPVEQPKEKKQWTPKPAGPAEELPLVSIGGVDYIDYRSSSNKQKNPNFPDFKDLQQNPKWLLKNGEPTPFFAEAEAAGVL